MHTRPPAQQHDKVSPPKGPALRMGATCPEQVMAWRRERLAHCIATLLRDPVVARTVARSVAASGAKPANDSSNEIAVEDGCRSYWLDGAAKRQSRG